MYGCLSVYLADFVPQSHSSHAQTFSSASVTIVCHCMSLFACLSLFRYVSLSLSICLFICSYLYLFTWESVSLTISHHPSLYPSVCLSLCLYVLPSFCVRL